MKTIYIVGALAFSLSLGFSAEGEKKAGEEKPKHDPEKVFSKKDADSDKKLSKEEFLKNAKDPAKAEKNFSNKDKDSDGFLTLEEFKAQGGKKKDKGI